MRSMLRLPGLQQYGTAGQVRVKGAASAFPRRTAMQRQALGGVVRQEDKP